MNNENKWNEKKIFVTCNKSTLHFLSMIHLKGKCRTFIVVQYFKINFIMAIDYVVYGCEAADKNKNICIVIKLIIVFTHKTFFFLMPFTLVLLTRHILPMLIWKQNNVIYLQSKKIFLRINYLNTVPSLCMHYNLLPLHIYFKGIQSLNIVWIAPVSF